MLGSDSAAKYYIAFTIGNFLLQVPDAVGTSLFVEGSHGESMRKNVIRAAGAIYAILIPGVIFFYIFGGQILGLFGKDYAESIELLRIFAFTSLFFAVYCLIVPVLNVRMNVKRVIQLNAVICVLFMSMSYVFLQWFGITGAGPGADGYLHHHGCDHRGPGLEGGHDMMPHENDSCRDL